MARGEKILHKDIIQEGNPFEVLIKAIKDVLNLLDEVKKSAKGNSFLTGKDFKDAEKSQIELAIATEKLTKLQEQNNKIRAKAKELAEEQKRIANDELGTLEKLAYQNKQLSAERKKLNLETQAGKDRLKQINAELDRNNRIIKDNSDQLTKQKINIGNYASAWKGLVSVFSKVVGGLAAVGITFGTFKKVMGTTDELADKFKITMTGIERATGAFFKTIATGDWTNLISNMEAAYKVGLEYATLLDRLEHRRAALDYLTTEEKIRYSELEEAVKNTSLTEEQRIAAGKEWKMMVDGVYEREKTYYKQNLEAQITSLAMKGKEISEVEELFKQYLKLDALDPQLRKNAEEYNAALKERNRLAIEMQAFNASGGMKTEISPEGISFQTMMEDPTEMFKSAEAALKGYSVEAVKFAELLDMIEGEKKTERINAVIDALKKKNESEFAFYQENKRMINTLHTLDKKSMDNVEEKKVINLDFLQAEQEIQETELFFIDEKRAKEDEFLTWLDQKRDSVLEAELQRIEKEKAAQQELKNQRIYVAQETANFIGEIGNMLYSLEQQKIRDEMQDAEELRDFKVNLAGDDSRKRAAAENEYQKKVKELKKKEAKQAKEQAIFNASINLAQAIARAFGDFPFPAAAIFAALSAVLAGAQLAAIIAQPLPSFRKGTKYLQADGTGSDKDGLLIQAHHGERIVPAKENKLIGDIENNQLPGLVYLGKKYNSEFPILAEIAEKQLREQRNTNGLLKKFKYVDKHGNIISIEGNIVSYV